MPIVAFIGAVLAIIFLIVISTPNFGPTIEERVAAELKKNDEKWRTFHQQYVAKQSEEFHAMKARWREAYGRLCERNGRRRKCQNFCRNGDCLYYNKDAAWRYNDLKKNGWKLRRLGL